MPNTASGDAVAVVETAGLGLGLLLVLGGAGWIGGTLWRRRRRARRIREAAEAAGWRWQAEDPSLVDAWPLAPFGVGEQRSTRHVIRGRHQGRDFVAFEYRYVHHERNELPRSAEFRVYVLSLPAALPNIQATPQGAAGQETRAFGVADVALDELDQEWTVRADDETFARALFDARMIELLRSTGSWTWGFAGSRMVASEPGRLDPDELPSRLDRMAAVLDRIPDTVWQTYANQSDPQH